MILEIELPQLGNVDIANVRKLKSLLSVVSSGVPFAVDISKMAQTAELNRNTIVNYLAHLGRAKLINLLYSDSFIAADNIEYALGNKIPLWLFGFLY